MSRTESWLQLNERATTTLAMTATSDGRHRVNNTALLQIIHCFLVLFVIAALLLLLLCRLLIDGWPSVDGGDTDPS